MPQHHVVQLLLMAAGAVAVLTLGWTVMDEHYAGPFNDVQTVENARDLDFKRRRFELECSPDALDDWLQPPNNNARRASRRGAVAKTIPRCPYLFIDLGANVGDSLGKFIDAGVTTSCPGPMYPAYSTEKGKLVNRDDDATSNHHSPPRQNRLTEWVREVLRDTSSQVGNTLHPEHYCYFGLEGNPVFTDRLRQLQVRAMHTKPRPVRSLYFFTETVVTDEDGPTVLYLDTTNGEKNYWGSSLYDTHPDVRASSAVMSAPVFGLSLSTLLQRIAIGSFGNHIMIKMDIEGAEFAVLNEAYESNILCTLASRAVRIDILVELHAKQTFLGPDESNTIVGHFDKIVKPGLRQCGVHIKKVKDAGRLMRQT